jgi:hypothetical protein
MIPGLGPVGPVAVTFSETPHRFNGGREVTSTNTLNVVIGLGSAPDNRWFCHKKHLETWTLVPSEQASA